MSFANAFAFIFTSTPSASAPLTRQKASRTMRARTCRLAAFAIVMLSMAIAARVAALDVDVVAPPRDDDRLAANDFEPITSATNDAGVGTRDGLRAVRVPGEVINIARDGADAMPRASMAFSSDGDGDARSDARVLAEREWNPSSSTSPHGERFMAWLAKNPERAAKYCGNAANMPCAESARREKIFEANIARVDAHNAKVPPGGMRMGVGKFADLTEEEFTHRHVQYGGRKTHLPRGERAFEAAALGAARDSVDGGEKRRTRVGDVQVSRDVLDASAAASLPVIDAKPAARGDGDDTETATTTKVDLDLRFKNFVQRYGKQKQYCPTEAYPCAEAYRRQEVFLSNLADIEETNSRGGMQKRVTRFADLESEEFAREHATYANITTVGTKNAVSAAHSDPGKTYLLPTLGDLSANAKNQAAAASRRTAKPLMRAPKRASSSDLGDDETTFNYIEKGFPRAFDWRTKIDIGPIYSQGMCSGCWAFTTAQVIGDSTAIATGKRNSVSPYHLLSCDNLDSECSTGNMATAYAWINVQDKGVLTASDFPEGSSCDVAKSPDTTGVKIEGYCEIAPLEGVSTSVNLMTALQQQTVAVGLNVKPLQLYGGGIVRLEDCPPASDDPLLAINHAAVLVGWGYDVPSKQPYWIMKNSYDDDWGEDGYAKLSMEIGEGGYGTCGLYTEQNYPLTDGKSCALGSSKKWSVKRGQDVYLEPDDVLVLPNGKGLISPFKFSLFGFDLTEILQIASMFCFSLCFVLVLVELYFCLFPELEHGGEDGEDDSNGGEAPSVGSALLKNAEEGYGTTGK